MILQFLQNWSDDRPDEDPGAVEDKEHNDGDCQNEGKVPVPPLLLQPPLCQPRSWKNINQLNNS